jgi:hypothetical protein
VTHSDIFMPPKVTLWSEVALWPMGCVAMRHTSYPLYFYPKGVGSSLRDPLPIGYFIEGVSQSDRSNLLDFLSKRCGKDIAFLLTTYYKRYYYT